MTSTPNDYVLIKSLDEFTHSNIQVESALATKPAFDYKLNGVFKSAFFASLGSLLAFFLCFFIIRGENASWPDAWWSFSFLAVGLAQIYNTLRSEPSKIKIEAKENMMIEFFNYFDRSLYGGSYKMKDVYESVAIKKKGSSEYVILVRKDSHMEDMKNTHKCASCCIGKEYQLCVEDVTKFRNDLHL